MKTSNIILYSVAGLIVLSIMALSLRMRSNLKSENQNLISENYQLSGFDRIEAQGKILLKIKQGTEFAIEFESYDGEFKKDLEINTRGDLLKITLNEEFETPNRIRGTITMPVISSLNTNGKTQATLEGFPAKQLHLTSLGKSHINLKNNQIDSLFVTCIEKGSINYRSGQTRFAHCEFSNITRSYFSGGKIGVVEGKIQDSAYVNFKTKAKKLRLELLDEARINRH